MDNSPNSSAGCWLSGRSARILDCYVFDVLDEVRRMIEEWRQRYNRERLPGALDRIPPVQFAMAKYYQPLLLNGSKI